MLLEFTVENYRSIKGPVTLSTVAQKAPKRKSSAKTKHGVKSDAEICPGFSMEGWDMELLPVIGIFGANASGKSNIVQAFSYLLSLMQGIYEQDKTYLFPTSHTRFNLEKAYKDKQTKFGLHIYEAGCIYRYHLELLGRKVIKENLDYLTSKTKRPRKLFRRAWSEKASQYIWENGEAFSGPHIQLESKLPQEELFISIMVRLKANITIPFQNLLTDYFGNHFALPIVLTNRIAAGTLSNSTTDFKHVEDLKIKESIIAMLKKFDTGIIDLEFRKSNLNESTEIYAIHQMATGEKVGWGFEEESLGTQRLFSFAYSIVMAFHLGGLLVFDELGTNLHPKITAYIIQLFQHPKTNPKGAQLIFTSHDNTLQRNQLLRRDQIWFTEKKPDQSTDLYSLADFKVRNDLAIDKAYLDGRFGAVPFLPDTVEELLGVE
jgi:uncharacterized protein